MQPRHKRFFIAVCSLTGALLALSSMRPRHVEAMGPCPPGWGYCDIGCTYQTQCQVFCGVTTGSCTYDPVGCGASQPYNNTCG
jgi:hypothetical protein